MSTSASRPWLSRRRPLRKEASSLSRLWPTGLDQRPYLSLHGNRLMWRPSLGTGQLGSRDKLPAVSDLLISQWPCSLLPPLSQPGTSSRHPQGSYGRPIQAEHNVCPDTCSMSAMRTHALFSKPRCVALLYCCPLYLGSCSKLIFEHQLSDDCTPRVAAQGFYSVTS